MRDAAAVFLTRLKYLPTAYFEAKIVRGVDLAEFSGAVVPEGTSQKVLDAMASRGITNIKTYGKDEGSRAKAIAALADELHAKDGNVLFGRDTLPAIPAPTPFATKLAGDSNLGVPPLKWVYGDDAGNVKKLMDVSLKSIENVFPSVKLIGYDSAKNQFFRTDTNQRFTDRRQLAGVVGQSIRTRLGVAGRDGSTGQAGWRTVARHSLFSHLKAAEGIDGLQDGGGILDRLRDVGSGIGRDPATGIAHPEKDRITTVALTV